MQTIGRDGKLLDAEFDVEPRPQGVDLVLHSRSGAKGNGARNPDYSLALTELLARLKGLGAVIRAIHVDSWTARRLPVADRILPLSYPIVLSRVQDVDALRLEISRTQRTVASSIPDGRGGNNNKRIRISVELPDGVGQKLASLLTGDSLSARANEVSEQSPLESHASSVSLVGIPLATKHHLQSWIVEALRSLGGSASLVDVARHIWQHHESDLQKAGDLFYTWQYDMRWAAQVLRDTGVLQAAAGSRRRIWVLASPSH